MKRLLFFFLAFFVTTSLFAVDEISLRGNWDKKKKRRNTRFDKNRLIVGGGLGGGSLQGGYIFSVTPSIGYRITDRFHAGINLGYFYSKQKVLTDNIGSFYQQNNRVVSTALFARYFPLDVVFLQVNPELNFSNQKYKEFYAFQNETFENNNKNTIPAMLVGGGYAQRLGGNSYMMISVMYDIIQNPNSPYFRQPVFGGGLALGLFGR